MIIGQVDVEAGTAREGSSFFQVFLKGCCGHRLELDPIEACTIGIALIELAEWAKKQNERSR